MNQAELHIENPRGRVIYHQVHTAPASWSEMTGKHLVLWAASFGTRLKVERAMQVVAAHLYNMPLSVFKVVPESQVHKLAKSIAFLYGKNQLKNWLIPSVWRGIFKYHGPKNGLANVTMHEFSLCELCYEQYLNTSDPEYLYTLAAILYRPCRFFNIDNDIRVKLTTHGYVKRAKRFKTLPLRVIYAIYLNYEGCRHFLQDKFKDAFEKPKGPKSSKRVKMITPWAKIIEAGSNDIFGTYEQTRNTNLHDYLSRLGTRIKEQRELEERLKK